MLVPSMNATEIKTQVYREFDKLFNTTVKRLSTEYDRERKKLKIDKTRMYVKDYHIKTTGKNNWIICIGKAASKEKYDGIGTLAVCTVVYYYTEKGIRVFNPLKDGFVAVYNGHLFQRYNERLHLNLSQPVDILSHFFKNDAELHDTIIEKQQRQYTVGFCKSGMLLGEYIPEDNWQIWKTFVSRDLTRASQHETENELLNDLYVQLEAALKSDNCDKKQVWMLQNKISYLTGRTIE